MQNPFHWIALYNDSSILEEYNNDTDTEVSFLDVDKKKTDYFAFINSFGAKIGFSTDNGVFDVGDYAVKFNLGDFDLNGSDDYHDIIQYKRYQTDYIFGVGQVDSITDSYYVGWKKSFETDKGTLFFKVVCEISLHNHGINFEVKISPNFDIEKEKFDITVDGNEFGSMICDIKKGQSITKKIWLQRDDEPKQEENKSEEYTEDKTE